HKVQQTRFLSLTRFLKAYQIFSKNIDCKHCFQSTAQPADQRYNTSIPLQIAYKPIGKPEVGVNGYKAHNPHSEVLPKGWNGFDAKPLDSDIRVDHDVEIKMKDGVRLYCDVYRPEGTQGNYASGLAVSSAQIYRAWRSSKVLIRKNFKWCPRGYAIVSVDSRGSGHSDGFIEIMNSQDAEDYYDVIEVLAGMDWCNGKVGMAGNSALAIIQWHAAAQRPPHLAAIAPWEGSGDIYREQFFRGGVFTMSTFDLITHFILKSEKGGGLEDFAEMYRRHPLSNVYWEDKRVDMTKVQCPVYICGSDLSSIHPMGSVRGWMEVPHDEKWIRWSSFQEWYELYCQLDADEELRRFFDRYLRDESNGWEKTPKVPWSALQFGNREAIHDIQYSDFPVPQTEYRELYLDNGKLSDSPLNSTSVVQYDSEDGKSYASFSYTFERKLRLLGLQKAVLHMSCLEHNGMSVFVILRKKDRDSNLLMHLAFPFNAMPYKTIEDIPEKERQSLNLHLGSTGVLRASHRAFDKKRSVPPGKIVELEIRIWLIGVDFKEHQSLEMQIGGQFPSIAKYTAFSKPRPEDKRNKG
ncbi:hypothetical protein D0863_04520, partial [Hortaea werneckii]